MELVDEVLEKLVGELALRTGETEEDAIATAVKQKLDRLREAEASPKASPENSTQKIANG